MAQNPSQTMQIMNEGEFMHHIAWTAPPGDSWKLSFASHYKRETQTASVGCILRDHNAIFIAGFGIPLGWASSVTVAQFSALRRALDFTISQGVDSLEIEGNHSSVFQMISREMAITSPVIRALVDACIYDLQNFRSVRLRQVRMYSNLAANLLARNASERQLFELWFDDPPEEIAHILDRDVIGRWIPLSLI